MNDNCQNIQTNLFYGFLDWLYRSRIPLGIALKQTVNNVRVFFLDTQNFNDNLASAEMTLG